jgi:hypothetical protein
MRGQNESGNRVSGDHDGDIAKELGEDASGHAGQHGNGQHRRAGGVTKIFFRRLRRDVKCGDGNQEHHQSLPEQQNHEAQGEQNEAVFGQVELFQTLDHAIHSNASDCWTTNHVMVENARVKKDSLQA